MYMLIYAVFDISMCYIIRNSVTGSGPRKQFSNICKNVKAGLLLSAVYSVLICVILVFFSSWISATLLSEPRAQMIILSAVPAAVCVIMTGTAKGYIYGCGMYRFFVGGQFIESVLLIGFSFAGADIGDNIGIKASALLVNKDIRFIYGAAGAMLGISAAELICTVYWLVLLKIFYRPMAKLAEDDTSTGGGTITGIMKLLFSKQLPDMLIGFLIASYFPLTMRFYTVITSDKTDRLAVWGEYHAVYLAILGIGTVICCMDVSGGIRSILRAQEKDEQNKMNRLFNNAFRHMISVGIPTALFIAALGNNIAMVTGVGSRDDLSDLFAGYSLIVITASICLFYGTILIKKGYISEMLICTAVSYLVSVIAAASFISGMKSMTGAAIGILMFTVMDALMMGTILRKSMGMRIRAAVYLFKCLCAGGIYLAVLLILRQLMVSVVGDLAAVLVCFIAGGILYVFLLVELHVLPERQIKAFPFGELMLVLFRGADEKIEK